MPYARADYSNEELELVASVYNRGITGRAGLEKELGKSNSWINPRLRYCGHLGLLKYHPPTPGMRVTQVTTDSHGQPRSIQQKPDHGEPFELPAGHQIKGVSALVDPEGREIVKWIKTKEGGDSIESLRIVADELNKTLKRIKPIPPPKHCLAQLANQYTITDFHFGMLCWGDETLNENFDLEIAERLLLDWFGAAIATSPKAHTGIFCQLGDFLHIDSHVPITPAGKHVLDADSRYQKIIRVVIRVSRQIIAMLLQRHEHVHVIMASANHDKGSSAWLRETFASFFDKEPRLSVDSSPGEYYAYEWGDTALFYHHGHRRQITNVDSVFAGMFREVYGRAKYSYGHIGHLHSYQAKEGNLMLVERHRTLAPPDAYAASGGWLSKQDAKVISYHKEWGEVGRLTISPMMVRGQ